jgi:hypothetical protein
MLAKAQRYERQREDFENLAMAYLRLAQQADRNAKLGQQLEPDDPAAHQKQQSEQALQQQQQRAPKDKTTD